MRYVLIKAFHALKSHLSEIDKFNDQLQQKLTELFSPESATFDCSHRVTRGNQLSCLGISQCAAQGVRRLIQVDWGVGESLKFDLTQALFLRKSVMDLN